MKVVIELHVQKVLWQFYDIAMQRHPSLDEATVVNKIDRLFQEIQTLRYFPYKCPLATFNRSWMASGYHDLIVEDIHIAYEIAEYDTGELFVHVVDAEHSLLHHD